MLSIITINQNNSLGLKKTVESVVNQTWKDFEYIVIDGDSTDGSFEVIKDFKESIDYWISENDTGIYNAMNKGIKEAKGDYILFLNSGDYLINDYVLEMASSYLTNLIDFVSGNLEFFKDEELQVRKHPNIMSFSFLVSKVLSHPSTFIKREMFKLYGLYNEDLEIVSDWEFFFKALGLNGASYKSIDVTISHFDMFGISSKQAETVKQERKLVFEKYLPYIYNNEVDTYIFDKFKAKNKRIILLMKIDKSPFFRKMVTVLLTVINKIQNLLNK